MTEQDQEVISKVETFIRRCHDLDFVFSAASWKLRTTAKEGESKSFADGIARAMSEYDWFKEFPEERMKKANVLLWWMNRAFAVGVVREGEGLVNRNRYLEANVAELRDQVRKLTAELEKLRETE